MIHCLKGLIPINNSDSMLKFSFLEVIRPLLEYPQVQEMKKYIQHGNTTCFQHCVHVAYLSYVICRFLSLNWRAAARAGMLHDFFLYDWHKDNRRFKSLCYMHGFHHPSVALKNANALFDLSNREQDIILNHMFPLTFYRIPKYKETIVISIVDKICCITEFLSNFRKGKQQEIQIGDLDDYSIRWCRAKMKNSTIV